MSDKSPTQPTAERDDDRHLWQQDAAGFLTRIQPHGDLWLGHSDLKYLTLRVDTRDGAFLLFDREGKPLRMDRVLEAINGR
jgi:hypothetical protein